MASGDKYALGAGATNTSTASDGTILVSNGDDTSSFITPSAAGLYTIDTSVVSSSVALSSYTTAGIYNFTDTNITDLPSNIPSGADYLVLTVKPYSTTNGVQILESADYDSSTTQLYQYYRAWEGSNFTDWFQTPLFNESYSPSSGQILTATGTGANFAVEDSSSSSTIFATGYRISSSSWSSGWHSALAMSSRYTSNSSYITWPSTSYMYVVKAGYYRLTATLGIASVTGSIILLVSSSSSRSNTSGNYITATDCVESFTTTRGVTASNILPFDAGDKVYMHFYIEDDGSLGSNGNYGNTGMSLEFLEAI